MRRAKIVLVAMTAVTALVVTLTGTASASALTGQSDVQKIIQAKTGKTAAPMTEPQKVGDVSIGTGRSAGKALESYTQKLDAKSTRVLAVVKDASQSVVTYPVTSPAGARVEPQSDGSLNLVSDIAGSPADQSGTYKTSAMVTTINKPWAVDAAGKSLPTTYAFAGGVLTQKINTTGATFPVVADPWITWGIFMYVHFSRVETFKLWNAWKLGTPTEVAGLCALFALGHVPGIVAGVGCAFYVSRVIADINVTVNYAVHTYHKRLVIKMFIGSLLYAGSTTEYAP